MKASFSEQELKRMDNSKKPLLWVGLVSIIMFFAGLTSAVIVSKASTEWFIFEIPTEFMTSTILIVISSLTFQLAYWTTKKENHVLSLGLVLVTFLLGIGFAISQFAGWSTLTANGVVAAGSESWSSGSYWYALSAVHLAHLFGGLISLLVVAIKSGLKKYSSDKTTGFQVSLTYWHFLGVLWLYIYIFFSVIL